jgi:hypothetical protein
MIKTYKRGGMGAGLRRTFVPLWLLAAAAAGACSAEDAGKPEATAQSDDSIVFQNITQEEYDSTDVSNNAKEWATAVGLLTDTTNLDRTSNGVPKNCPDKTQTTFACTAVLKTFDNYLCSDELWHAQKFVAPACTAFMIKNDPDQPAIFATAGHCIADQADCNTQSVILHWRPSSNFPGGNPNILEQHIYQCTTMLAHGSQTSGIVTSPGDWAVFQVDRHVTGGGVTGGPLTPDREALPLSTVGPVPGGGGTTIGHPLGLPTKIDEEVEMGPAVSPRGTGTFFAFLDAMEGQSGAPLLDDSGEVVGILGEAQGPILPQNSTCHRQCFNPLQGEPACPPLTGMDADATKSPTSYATVAVDISQLPSQFRTSAEHVMILLDQTGSMTTATSGARTRWDDAIDAALAWVQFDKLSSSLVDRAYSIWTFRDDTVIGGTQTGPQRIWPQSNSSDCANFETATGYCLLPRTTGLESPQYDALQDRLEAMREAQRAVVGPNTPLAHSLCQGLQQLKAISGLKRVIVESDGGENSTALDDLCFGTASDPFGDWSIDLSLRNLEDWGMTLDSWQAKVVRGATRFGLPLADAVSTPLGSLDFFPFDLVWQVDVHYSLAEPSSASFARTLVAPAPLEYGGAQPLGAQAARPVSTAAVTSLAASGTPSIEPSELSFFSNLGQATPRSRFTTYVHETGEVFGVDHAVAGDVNDDGCVDQADLCVMQQNDVWQHRAEPPNTQAVKADLDRDGWVNTADQDFLTTHWGGGCAHPPALPNIDAAIAACRVDYGRRWTSFEDAQRPWTRGVGSVILSTTTSAASDRLQSLQVNGCQYATIISPIFNTRELPAGNKLSIDVRLPTQQQNPYWLGDVQLFITIPSAGINNVWLGQRLFQGLSLGSFHALDFTLPSAVKTALAGNHPDAQITIALNTGNCLAPVLIDNVRVRN